MARRCILWLDWCGGAGLLPVTQLASCVRDTCRSSKKEPMERKVSTGEYGAVDEFLDVFAGIRIDAPHAEGNAFVRKPSC